MVETISPVGYGDRTGRWLAAVALHAVGATVTAAAFGAALGAAGSLIHAPWAWATPAVVAVAAALYAARELFGLALPVPAARRQVPDWWRSFFSWPVAAALYGAGLGIGFFTFLTHGGLVVVTIAAVAAGSPALGAVLVGTFGFARGLSALVARPVRTRDAGAALVDRLAAADPAVWRRANGVGLMAVAAAAFVDALNSDGPLGPTIATSAAAVVALAFAWSATAKLVAPATWRRTLSGHALPPPVLRAAFGVVPVVEFAVTGSVVIGFPAFGSAVAMALLASFSVVIVRTRVRSGRNEIACGCFGRSRARDYRLVLARNAALGGLAALGFGAVVPEVAWWPGGPAANEVVPFALATSAAAVAVLTAWRAVIWMGRSRA